MMEEADYNTVWDWGEASHEFVDSFLKGERDGTFLVFREGNSENITLAVRVNGKNKYVKVYHEDGLFGFAEPLNFETLEDALDAYNWSPTDSGNTLITPGIKPGSTLLYSRTSRSSMYEADPLTLLKSLRQIVSQLREKGSEFDSVQEENKNLEERIQTLSNSLDSLVCLEKIVEAQIRKHHVTASRSSVSSRQSSDAFTENYEKLTSRLSELGREKRQVAEEKNAAEQEKTQAEKRLANSHTEIEQIVNERMAIRRVLLMRNPDFDLFLESLMDDDLLDYSLVEILNIDKSAAERRLKSCADGTFLVRNSKGDPHKPYVISISHMAKVLHFPVLHLEGCFGLDENTCIFENIDELVKHYSRVYFSVHDEKYGTLMLTKQLS